MRIEDVQVIRATPETVWALTADIERWPSITPTITSVERLDDGPLRVGSRARLSQPRQPQRVWTVSTFDPPRRFEWSTRVGPLTMTGGHLVEPAPEGCRNRLSVEVTGFGAGLFGLLVKRQLAAAIRTENDGFRRTAESAGSAVD